MSLRLLASAARRLRVALLGALPVLLAVGCGDRVLPPEPSAPEPGAPAPALAAAQAANELFISEYIEGTSNNKAIEIYNGTGAAVNLGTAGYNIQMYFNGSTTAGLTINLTGTVAAGDVFVLAQSSANATILAQADQTNGSGWYNGDDAVVLRRGTTVIDVIGQIGFDPGTEWGTGLLSTADNTLRRKVTVCQGDAIGADVFDPATEWDGYATDTFGGLGAHSANCGVTPPTVVSTVPANGATDVAPGANLTVTFSQPVAVTGTWFTINCSVSGPHPAAVSGGATAFTLDPDADFTPGESCTATILAANVADQANPSVTMATNFAWSFQVQSAAGCAAPFTAAYAIQGSGATTPLAGQVVTTQGVVVGDYEGASPTLRGFFLQDATGDGDPATSDGIFVFNGSTNSVSVGDVVRVTGTAEEFQGQTQIGGTVTVTACGSTGAVTPADVTLPVSSSTFLERYEGMLVRLPQTLTVTETFQLGRFGEVVLSSGGRLSQPTNVALPGAAAAAVQAQNDLNRILVDDELNNQNRDPILFGRFGLPLSASNTLRGGDEVTGVVGVLTYTWAGNSASPNAYRVRPVNALGGGVPSFQPANPRPAAVPAVGGSLKVASFNLLNYFNTFGALACTNGVGGTATDCRGAENTTEFQRQRAKTIAALLKLDADVVGVIEVENDGYGPSSAIQDLVSELNAATAPGTWAFVDADAGTGQVNALGTDAIKVGLLYRPAKVAPVGQTAVLNSVAFVNGGDGTARNRPALAQAFAQPNGARAIVVVNHLKSKGSACDVPDQNDGQGECNLVRVNAANALRQWLATDPTDTGDPDVLIVGDLNAYAKEDPVTTLAAGGFTDLIAAFGGPSAYSYVFNGQWGSLDHALASASLVGQVAGAADYHINADEPTVLDYNTNFKTPNLVASLYSPDEFRTSDHDPLVVGLNLGAPTLFPFSWLSPVQAPPVFNVAAAGAPILVRFSLGGNRGLNVFAAGFPASRPVSCTTGVGSGARTAIAYLSPLSYSTTTNSYSFGWRRESGWAGTCRELVVRFTDGAQYRALYRFQ